MVDLNYENILTMKISQITVFGRCAMAVCGKCKNVDTQGRKGSRTMCCTCESLSKAMMCDTMKMSKKKERKEKGGGGAI